MQLIDSGVLPAERNMEIDRELLEKFSGESPPILRWYRFAGGAATYGHFTRPEELFDRGKCQAHSLSLAKRPTGGGVIFHFTDLTFSLFLPESHPWYSQNTLTSYQNVNRGVISALGRDLSLLPESTPSPKGRAFCMAHPTKYDILWEGKKVGGAAQRRVKGGFLHQASLNLRPPPYEILEELLLEGKKIVSQMKESSSCLLSEGENSEHFREKFRTALTKQLVDG